MQNPGPFIFLFLSERYNSEGKYTYMCVCVESSQTHIAARQEKIRGFNQTA